MNRRTAAAASQAPAALWAAGVFTLAFILRLVYILEIRASPFFENLVIDCARYWDWAGKIAAGDWAGKAVFYQSPLYAYFLAVIQRFLGADLLAVRLLQALIGSVSCVLIMLIARMLWGRRTGLLAGVLAACYGPFIYHDAMVMKTVLSVFLAALGLLLLLHAFDSRKPLLWLGCGLAWGAAALVRENYLLVAGGFAIWLLVRYLRNRPKEKLVPFWAFVGGAAIAILPVAIRNAAVAGEFALVTSQAGQNFYIGNNPANRTGGYEVPEFVIANPYWEEKSFRKFAERSTGKKMSAGEVSAFYRSRALSWAAANPGRAALLNTKKFLLFFNNYEVADNQSIYFMERYSWLLSLDFVRFGIIAPLGLLGFVLLWKGRRRLAALYIFAAVYAAGTVPFFIFGRYRLPVTLALLPLAAFSISWIAQHARKRNWRELRKPAIVLGCLFAFVYLPIYRYHGEAMAMRYINLGQIHLRLGQTREALEAYAGASKLLPGAAEPHLYAARALAAAGRFTESEAHFRAAIRKAPSMAGARIAFARFLFDRVGAFFEAYEMLETAFPLEPGNTEAKELKEAIRAALTDTEFYREKLLEDPDDVWALTGLGVAALLRHDHENAFAPIEKALKLNPEYIPANNAMALAQLCVENHAAAAFYARRVRELGGTPWSAVEEGLAHEHGHNHHDGHHHEHDK